MQLGQRRFSPDVSALLAVHDARISNQRVIGPMDLAVEVISSSTRAYDLDEKLPAYREGQVGEIWLIDSERRQFVAHARVGEDYVAQVLATEVWQSRVLEGFTLQVDWLWRRPLPSLRECATVG
jgi:Uma2 family endonuclease